MQRIDGPITNPLARGTAGAPFPLKCVAVSLMLAYGSHVLALPTGGAVSAGGATIFSSGSTTTIGQTTQKAAINWQSFSIGQGEAGCLLATKNNPGAPEP